MLHLLDGYEIPLACLALLIVIVYWDKIKECVMNILLDEPQHIEGARDGDSQDKVGSVTYELEEKDSLEDQLKELSNKLALNESKYHISKTKIRQTRNEIDNMNKIAKDVKEDYKNLLGSLKNEMLTNEMECKKLQKEIELISKKKAHLLTENAEESKAMLRNFENPMTENCINFVDQDENKPNTCNFVPTPYNKSEMIGKTCSRSENKHNGIEHFNIQSNFKKTLGIQKITSESSDYIITEDAKKATSPHSSRSENLKKILNCRPNVQIAFDEDDTKSKFRDYIIKIENLEKTDSEISQKRKYHSDTNKSEKNDYSSNHTKHSDSIEFKENSHINFNEKVDRTELSQNSNPSENENSDMNLKTHIGFNERKVRPMDYAKAKLDPFFEYDPKHPYLGCQCWEHILHPMN